MHDFIAKYIIHRLATHPGIESVPGVLATIREDADNAWKAVVSSSGVWPYRIREEDKR